MNTEHAPMVEDRQVGADLVGLRLLESNLDLHALWPGRLLADLAALEKELHAAVLLYVNPPESGAETFRSVITQVPGIPFVVLSGTDVHHKRALPTLHYALSDHRGWVTSVQSGSRSKMAILSHQYRQRAAARVCAFVGKHSVMITTSRRIVAIAVPTQAAAVIPHITGSQRLLDPNANAHSVRDAAESARSQGTPTFAN